MAQDYSFDVVSQFDRQELVNAVNQAQREIVTRYDFKDTGASIDLGETEITLHGPSDFKLKAMIDVLQSKLVKRQLSLKILKPGPIEPAAEPCAGGMLVAALTDVPGSSTCFRGGVISYADAVKLEQLGVPDASLRQYGSVSEQTAAAMASGVRQRLHADVGVSVTGVAGPDAEGSKPVGLTFIGIATTSVTTHRFQWTGDRWDNRRRSVIAALELLVSAPEL